MQKIIGSSMLNSGTRITEDSLKKITGEYDLEVMQWLELPSMGITRIENLRSCISIRTLTLRDNQIRAICGLEGLLSLERLDLSSNCIRRIENLGHLTTLQSLDLKGNIISNVDDVGTLIPLPNLRRFSLQGYEGDKTNPVVTRLLPRLEMLDGESLNLRQCIVDAILNKLKPDDEALKSPKRERWCADLDWTSEAADVELHEDLSSEVDTLRDILDDCARLNSRAQNILKTW